MTQQLAIGEEQLRDQKERMVEEWGVPEEEAEEAFKTVKTHVSLRAQDMGKNWSEETLNAVTNLVIAIQQQQHVANQQRKAHFYDRLFRFVTSSLQMTAVGTAAVFAYYQMVFPMAIALCFAVSIWLLHLKR